MSLNDVRSDNQSLNSETKNCVVADVIILGCSLPGIVTAHKLKEKFGNTIDIVVLDLPRSKNLSKHNVSFRGIDIEDVTSDEDEDTGEARLPIPYNKKLLVKFTKEFAIPPIPDFIIHPKSDGNFLNKLFQNYDGSTIYCTEDFTDYTYLNFLERFELKQYHKYLDYSMMALFLPTRGSDKGRDQLMFFDRTCMEEHICWYLLFPTSREIMRITVRLVCGAPPETISVLFYLHQCFRSNGCRNHIDGDNTMFREKLLGYVRKRLAYKLEESVADIILTSKPIREIRQYSNEQVILETLIGGTDYVCNLLAMAIKPDQLQNIQVQNELVSPEELALMSHLCPTKTKKFFIQYEDNFWRRDGCSGDILSLRGPILWAIEKPRLSQTGKNSEKYSGLIGYLKDSDSNGIANSCKAAVLEQLVNFFGQEAAKPVMYIETEIQDLFVPPCGEYLSLQNLRECHLDHKLIWSALDVYADGDVGSAIHAGHVAYLHLVKRLRPQAQDFEATRDVEGRIVFHDTPLNGILAKFNYPFCLQVLAISAGAYMAFSLFKVFRNLYKA